jgi:hypothetical protein
MSKQWLQIMESHAGEEEQKKQEGGLFPYFP